MTDGDFHRDLDFADTMRQRLDRHFYPAACRDGRFVPLERSLGSLYIQRECHVDCVVAAKGGGSKTVEEKIVRWKGRRYSAITVETHSNLERTNGQAIGDGWIATSSADFLLYAFAQADGSLVLWLFDLPKLRAWFYETYELYATTDTHNREGYTTRCRVVPLEDIPSACVRLREVPA